MGASFYCQPSISVVRKQGLELGTSRLKTVEVHLNVLKWYETKSNRLISIIAEKL